jgi:hypothetical protein
MPLSRAGSLEEAVPSHGVCGLGPEARRGPWGRELGVLKDWERIDDGDDE